MRLHLQYNKSAHLLLLLLLCMYCGGNSAISIDNDIIGEPDIECLDQEIRVWVKTRKPFAGRIFAKGKSEDPSCSRSEFGTKRTKKPRFDLPLGMCGMKSLRSFDPRGMYYGITLVISFHTLFITKIDQAFHVKCFFEEANRGVTAELGVSMIPTTEVEARHGIPGCTYSIHRSSIADLDAGRPAGTPIQFAKVGDKVLHQWHCDDHGVNKKAQVIDDKGCPIDPISITGIQYSSDLQRAYAESQVFKFADRPGVWFFCQIQMCMKKDGMCDGFTPPGCATTGRPPTVERRGGLRGGNRRGDSRGSESNNDEDPESADSGGSNSDYNLSTLENRRSGTGGNNRGKNGNRRNDYDEDTEKGYESENGDSSRNDAGRTKRPTRPSTRHQEHVSDPYGSPSVQSSDYDNNLDESKPVTIFGPAYSPSSANGALTTGSGEPGYNGVNLVHDQPKSKKIATQEIVSDFEATDELSPRSTIRTPVTKSPRKGTKLENIDYNADENDSDVTIPPNLVDLLANLPPDQINADNLQKMFRDSVADRRALLNGFDALINKMRHDQTLDEVTPLTHLPTPPMTGKAIVMDGKSLETSEMVPGTKIDSMHVSWDSSGPMQLARDSPLPDSSVPSNEHRTLTNRNSTQKLNPLPPTMTIANVEPPMIAGQLLIYDLDETPPDEMSNEAGLSSGRRKAIADSDEESANLESDCALTRQGLLLLAISFSSLVAALIIAIVTLFFKVRKVAIASYRRSYLQHSNSKRSDYLANSLPISSTTSSLSVFGTDLAHDHRNENAQNIASQLGVFDMGRKDDSVFNNSLQEFSESKLVIPPRPSLAVINRLNQQR